MKERVCRIFMYELGQNWLVWLVPLKVWYVNPVVVVEEYCDEQRILSSHVPKKATKCTLVSYI